MLPGNWAGLIQGQSAGKPSLGNQCVLSLKAHSRCGVFHINQSRMDIRRYRSSLDERLLSQSHLRCSMSQHQVVGGGIFGNIQMIPCIFSLFTLMFFPPQINLAIFSVPHDDTLCSQLLRPKIIIISNSFSPILTLSTALINSILNPHKFCLPSDP